MKTLLLIRHAKSDWGHPLVSDYERGLNARGRRDAPMMGRRIGAHGWTPDAFVCSSAARARQTAEAMAPGMPFAPRDIQWRDDLYLARPEAMLEIIRATPDEVGTLALLAHNPGITDLCDWLCPEADIFNVPTAGVVALSFDADRWRDIDTGTLIDFDYPKKEAEA